MKTKQASIKKITPPALPEFIFRERLFHLLDRRHHYQITWISGMAGSGKTTLAASYAYTRKLPFLWYQMDESDDDIATLFYYLGLAVKKATPRKRKPLPFLTPEYSFSMSVFAQRYFENLSNRLTPPSFMIFDDYHKLSEAAPLHDVLQAGLSKVSPEIHVFILSRTEPPPSFSRMLANDKMRIIGSAELRLDVEESIKIAEREPTRKLPRVFIEQLHAKTKGWAAGLVLMVKSTIKDNIRTNLFDQLIPSNIFDYFATELFDRLDETTKSFLLKTAFFPKMTAPMAHRLTGCDHVDRILSSLRRSHLFIDKFSTSLPMYQYHPLFREFLISRSKESFSKEEIFHLRQQVAGLLEESDQVEDAVDLYSS